MEPTTTPPMDIDDPVVAVIPIQLSSALDPHLQLFQFPLLSRPLTVPPSANNAGKSITARCKPKSDKIEIHIPFDTRQEVWNQSRGLEYGDARREEDGKKPSSREEYRLEELRLRSERVPHRGMYMVGVIRGSKSRIPPSRDLFDRTKLCQTVYIFTQYRPLISSVLTSGTLMCCLKRSGENPAMKTTPTQIKRRWRRTAIPKPRKAGRRPRRFICMHERPMTLSHPV